MTELQDDPIRELARLNPVTPEDLRLSIPLPDAPQAVGPSEKTSRTRFRLVAALAGATALVVAASLALPISSEEPESPGSFLRATAAVAADQTSLVLAEDEFARRSSRSWLAVPAGQRLPPGPPVIENGAVEREHVVWLNLHGGGDSDQRLIERAPCTFESEVLTYVAGPLAAGGCHGGGIVSLPLLDERLGVGVGGAFEIPALSAIGAGVDDLPADSEAIGEALERAESDLSPFFRREFPDSEAGRTAALLGAVAELLANPVASPEVRAAAFEYAASLPGMTLTEGVEDPLGRSGTAVSIERPTAQSSPVNFGWPGGQETVDFGASDTVVRDEVIIDPETSDVLATQTSLVSTDLDALSPWLAEVGSPALAAYRAYQPISVERRADLVRSVTECPNGDKIIHESAVAPPASRVCGDRER